MSAICGQVHLDGSPPSPDAIARMSNTLAHRGMDASGVWCDEQVALGHCLLHTTPESVHEIQPLAWSQQGLVLVADARIDNRQELLTRLGISSHESATDSEIILAAYVRWGEECAAQLIGDFAFCVWDSRQRAAFCARDPMGVKPLYYILTDRLFAFASEIKGLLTIQGVGVEIDPEQVALYLGVSQGDRARTLYRDVLRLPAAHSLRVTKDRAVTRRYWTPTDACEVRFNSAGDYVDAFTDIFTEAVGARLRCEKPVGSTLSGGLDSSSITCMSRRLQSGHDQALHTFSVIFPNLPEGELRLIDERAFIDAVLRQGGLQPHFVRGDELSPLGELSRVLWHLDEPHPAPNLYLHWGMYRAAQENGVRVLLDGFDGDSVVSHGFGRLTGLARLRDWKALEAEVRAFSSHHRKPPSLPVREYVLPHLGELAGSGRWLRWLQAATELAGRFNISPREMALEHGLRPLLPDPLLRFARALNRRAEVEQSLLQPELAKVLDDQRQRATTSKRRRGVMSERETHLDAVTQPLYQLTLEIADKCAAAFGIEARYPFFDRRLIEFCIGLPEDQKFNDGWPRSILRRAMSGILPPAVQWRSTKANLAPNFYRRLGDDLKPHNAVADTILSPYIRADRLRNVVDQCTASDPGAMKAEGLVLFRVEILRIWLAQQSSRSRPGESPEHVCSPVAA